VVVAGVDDPAYCTLATALILILRRMATGGPRLPPSKGVGTGVNLLLASAHMIAALTALSRIGRGGFPARHLDLLARGRTAQQRTAGVDITGDRAVWEANHVWLIWP